MKADKIEDILSKNGVEHSENLANALEEILKVYSKDKELAKNVTRNIENKNKLDDVLHGRRWFLSKLLLS